MPLLLPMHINAFDVMQHSFNQSQFNLFQLHSNVNLIQNAPRCSATQFRLKRPTISLSFSMLSLWINLLVFALFAANFVCLCVQTDHQSNDVNQTLPFFNFGLSTTHFNLHNRSSLPSSINKLNQKSIFRSNKSFDRMLNQPLTSSPSSSVSSSSYFSSSLPSFNSITYRSNHNHKHNNNNNNNNNHQSHFDHRRRFHRSHSTHQNFDMWPLSTTFTASSPPLLLSSSALALSLQSDAPITFKSNLDNMKSTLSHSDALSTRSMHTLAPPPYLLNLLARPAQFSASEVHVMQQRDFINRPLNDQQWSETNSDNWTQSSLPDSLSTLENNVIDVDDESIYVSEPTWFDRLRALLTGRKLVTGPPMNSTSIALLNKTRLQYYSDYDVMMGVRIAVSLSSIISLFALFITYKSYCNARKQRLRANNPPNHDPSSMGSFSRSSRKSRCASTKATPAHSLPVCTNQPISQSTVQNNQINSLNQINLT